MWRCRSAVCAVLTAAAVLGGLPAAVAAGADPRPAATASPSPAQPVMLTAQLARGTVDYGQDDTVSGTVLYQPGPPSGPAEPLVAATVTIQGSAAGSPPITAVTDSSGDFTAALPAQTATGTWTVSAGGTPALTEAQQVLALTVLLPTAPAQVRTRLSAAARVSVAACLNVISPGGREVTTSAPLTLQYARAARGPWRKLAVIRPAAGIHYCREGTAVWQASVAAPLASAYYRLSFAGAAGLEPSRSPAVHRWRHRTKITSFAISPRTVAAQGAITVSGRLWQHRSGAWYPDAGRKAVVFFRFRGYWYYFLHKPRTNDLGYFSGLFTAYVTAKWEGRYDGSRRHFASTSRRVRVMVTRSRAMPRGFLDSPGFLRSCHLADARSRSAT